MTAMHCVSGHSNSHSTHAHLCNDDSVDEEYVMTPLPATPKKREPTALAAPPSWSTAALAGAADVAFRCDYDGVLESSRSAATVFRIRVLHDGTLQGEELQFRTRAVAIPSSTCAASGSATHQTKRPKLPTATRPAVATPAPGVRARDEWVVTAHLEGRATPQRPHHRFHEPLQMDDTYCCYFDVLPVDSSASRAFACHTHFTPHDSRMSGYTLSHADKPFWITPDAPCELLVQEIHREAFAWTKRRCASASVGRPVGAALQQEDNNQAAERVSASKQRERPTAPAPVKSEADASGLTLYPLTPGLYEFRGFTTIAPPPRPASAPQRRRRRRDSLSSHDTPTKDECFVTLQLLHGGVLEGTSRELLRPQSCPVKGKWRADRMRYILMYKVRDAVGQFRYSGRIEGARKIVGRWANVDTDGLDAGYSGGRGDFELELTQAVRLGNAKTVRPDAADSTTDDDAVVRVVTSHKIRVLTTGGYTLKGCATDDDGYEYACELYVQLLSSGELRGTTRELVFDQTRRITGTWTAQGITYTQVYVVKGDVGEYVYTGSIDADGGILTGNWTNTNAKDSESPGERGTFAYGIAHARRQWSCHSHAHYPQSFRTAVRLVLLCSSRTHALPHALWCRVFEFCDATWFA